MTPPLPEHLKKTYILLADDDPFIRRVVRHILQSLGFECIKEAEDAKSVISMLGVLPYGVLISDVQMPGISGIELLRQIRSGQTNGPADLPVIILTSFAHSDVLKTALALDVNGFLVKPIKPNAVYEKIIQAFGERISLRPASDYASVITELASLAESQIPDKSTASISRPVSSEAIPGNAIEVRIRDLHPGMQLVRPIYLNDGMMLLSRGKTLEGNTINRLREMQEVLKSDLCLIVKGDSNA